MARHDPTKIERLDHKHPGLRQYVDLRLEANRYGEVTRAQIAQEVEQKFGAQVSKSNIQCYGQRRWWPHKLRMEELTNRMEAIRAVLGEDAVSDSAQAMILEQLDEAMRAGARLEPKALMKLQLAWAKYAAKVEHDRARARLLAAAQSRQRRVSEVVREAEKAQSEGKQFDAAQALKKISEVIGVGAALEERVES